MELLVCLCSLDAKVKILSLYAILVLGMSDKCLFGKTFGWVKTNWHLLFMEFMFWIPLDILMSVGDDYSEM